MELAKISHKEGATLPLLNFGEFEKGWSSRQLKEVLTLVNRPLKMKDDQVYSLVTVKRRYEGIIHRGYYKGKEIKVKSQFLLETNDFLISKRQISHNACGLVPKELSGAIVSNEYSVFIPKGNLDIEYFNYFCRLPKVSKTFFLSSIGVHIEKMLFKVDVWLKYKFHFPSLPEQQKIASFLSAIDEKIQKLTHKKELLEQYKKGVMQQLFSGNLHFKDENGKVYPKWVEKRLGDSAEIIGGGTPDTLVAEYWDGAIQWYTPTEISERFVAKSKRTISKLGLEKSSAKLLPVGTILFTSRATIAELSFAKQECTTNQGFQSLVVNDTNDPNYIFYWIKNNKKVFVRKSQGSTFLEISKTEMMKIIISLPCIEEQIQIGSYLSRLDTKIESVTNQITQTQTFKKGLLQQMFV